MNTDDSSVVIGSSLRIEYWKASDKQWYFHLKARNNKIVATSEGYKRFRSVMNTMRLFLPVCTHFVPKSQALQVHGSVYYRISMA